MKTILLVTLVLGCDSTNSPMMDLGESPDLTTANDLAQSRPDLSPDNSDMSPTNLGTVHIESGTVETGCVPDGGTAENVSAFDIDATEVTQHYYALCVKAGSCTLPNLNVPYDPAHTPNVPVSGISLTQAEKYCTFVGARLPTAAEWLCAATDCGKRKYPWGDDAPDCTRDNSNCDGKILPVASLIRGATPTGIYEMNGNVSEWTSTPSGGYQIVKGDNVNEYPRAACFELSENKNSQPFNVGIRCVR